MSDLNPQAKPTLVSRARMQTDAVTGEPVLLYPEGILVLNPTAHEILSRCDGKITIDELIRLLCEEYDEKEETVREDVVATLNNLRRRNLVTLNS